MQYTRTCTPGKAAALNEDKKTKTHSEQASFVPFIVETGGRINAAGLQFLSRILPLEASDILRCVRCLSSGFSSDSGDTTARRQG